ncbi:MAG: TetR/AcrR family transcriptional regulator, partial [Spongiibacter sp.]
MSKLTKSSPVAPPSVPATARSYHHGDLRSELLDAAARLLREEGEAGLSMRRLAQELGVSRTAPYHHFADKHS